METDVQLHDFREAFRKCRPDNFSYEGLEILFEYLIEMEDDCGQELELDVIAICCDFSEDELKDVPDNYSVETFEELEENTTALMVNSDTVMYQNY